MRLTAATRHPRFFSLADDRGNQHPHRISPEAGLLDSQDDQGINSLASSRVLESKAGNIGDGLLVGCRNGKPQDSRERWAGVFDRPDFGATIGVTVEATSNLSVLAGCQPGPKKLPHQSQH